MFSTNEECNFDEILKNPVKQGCLSQCVVCDEKIAISPISEGIFQEIIVLGAIKHQLKVQYHKNQ